MGLDYVDIFYSHRFDPKTPLEETMGALAHLHRQGKALYVGISSYSPELTREAQRSSPAMGVPLLIHQPSYSMLNRWIEDELLDTLRRARHRLHRLLAAGAGHAQRQISRAAFPRTPAPPSGGSLSQRLLSDGEYRAHPRRSNAIAAAARPDAWRRWRSPGCCATRASPRR